MGWIRNTWHHFTCQRYTELVSKSLDTRLCGWENVSFRLHHALCTFCRRSKRQLELLERAVEKVDSDEDSYAPEAALSNEAKERMKRDLSEGAER